jgi:hypothetical protein
MAFKRKLLIVGLSLGVVLGFGSELVRGHCGAHGRRAAFERHVADVCVTAARNGGGPGAAAAP